MQPLPRTGLIGDFDRRTVPLDRPAFGWTRPDAKRSGLLKDFGRLGRRMPQEAVAWLMRRFTQRL